MQSKSVEGDRVKWDYPKPCLLDRGGPERNLFYEKFHANSSKYTLDFDRLACVPTPDDLGDLFDKVLIARIRNVVCNMISNSNFIVDQLIDSTKDKYLRTQDIVSREGIRTDISVSFLCMQLTRSDFILSLIP